MIRYVCGFLFSPDYEVVALIKKNKPDFLKGYFNGIGGHIEEGEYSHDAMVREFEEETGVHISLWDYFCTLEGSDEDGNLFNVEFYKAIDNNYSYVESKTDEEVALCTTELIINGKQKVFNNLKWLIPMALCMDKDRAKSFVIQEVY